MAKLKSAMENGPVYMDVETAQRALLEEIRQDANEVIRVCGMLNIAPTEGQTNILIELCFRWGRNTVTDALEHLANTGDLSSFYVKSDDKIYYVFEPMQVEELKEKAFSDVVHNTYIDIDDWEGFRAEWRSNGMVDEELANLLILGDENDKRDASIYKNVENQTFGVGWLDHCARCSYKDWLSKCEAVYPKILEASEPIDFDEIELVPEVTDEQDIIEEKESKQENEENSNKDSLLPAKTTTGNKLKNKIIYGILVLAGFIATVTGIRKLLKYKKSKERKNASPNPKSFRASQVPNQTGRTQSRTNGVNGTGRMQSRTNGVNGTGRGGDSR